MIRSEVVWGGDKQHKDDGSMSGGQIAGTEGRIYHLDAARGMLMMLGILLHASDVYRGDWSVNQFQGHQFFHMLSDTIRSFRMPCFFFVSGYFCALSLGKRTPGRFLGDRLKRVGIPLLAVAFLLNVPVSMIVEPGIAADAKYWLYGGWVRHLWFLFALVVYFAIFSVFLSPLSRAVAAIESGFGGQTANGESAFIRLALVVFFVLAVAVALSRVFPAMYEPLLFLPNGFMFVWYFGFFFFGFGVSRSPAVRSGFEAIGWLPLVVGGALWFASLFLTVDAEAARLLRRIGVTLLPLGYIFLCISLFQGLVRAKSRAWSYLSDASYTIFLLHGPVVPLVGTMLAGVDLPMGVEWAIIVVTAALLPLAFHHYVVRRSSTARLVFNGRSAGRD